jgi:hypothetical protein
MKILIQDVRTGHYLQETGTWTAHSDYAQDFPSSGAALNARLRWQVAEARLVFRFEREGYLIAVPLDPVRHVPDAPRTDVRAQALEPA